MELAPAAKPWTKELDISLATTFQAVHGERVNSATVYRWDEVSQQLVASDKKDTWPESLTSPEALKKRWKLFRVWYAKAFDEKSGKDIHVPSLIRRLQERNYEEEGKRGRKKGSKRKSRDDSTVGNDSVEGVELLEEGPISPIQPTAAKEPITTAAKTSRNASASAAVNSDPRLDAWLSVLRNPLVPQNFRIHSHSGIILEPEILLNGVGIVSLLVAQSMAPPEWVTRIVDASDHKAIQENVTQKRSFFILPSSTANVLFILVIFHGIDPKKLPLFWIFCTEGEEEYEDESRENFASTIGLPAKLFTRNFQWKSTTVGEAKSLASLYLFSMCLSHITIGSTPISSLDEQISAPWPEEHVMRQMLLGKIIFNNPSVSLQSAPQWEPLALEHPSLLDALRSYGVSVPSWFAGFAADKRQDLVAAIRDITNTAVFVIDMSVSIEVTWNPKPTDKVVLMIAERNGKFGGIFRIIVTEDKRHKILRLLAKRASISKLQMNGTFVEKGECSFPSIKTVIQCIVDNVQLRFVCPS